MRQSVLGGLTEGICGRIQFRGVQCRHGMRLGHALAELKLETTMLAGMAVICMLCRSRAIFFVIKVFAVFACIQNKCEIGVPHHILC